VRSLFLAGTLAFGAATAFAQPVVQLSAWQPDQSGTGVRFEALTPLAESDPIQMQDEIANGAFEYAIDTSQIKWVTDCSCFRHYVIVVRTRATGQVTRHKFRALPSGSFDDQYAEITMAIRDSRSSGSVQIALPVASAPGLEPKPLLEITRQQTRPEYVSLGGATRLRLAVKNVTKRMIVVVPSDIVVRAEPGDLWTSATATMRDPAPFNLAPDATEVLQVDVQPETWRAIETSLVPIETDKEHATLQIDVPYTNPVFGNRTGVVQTSVPLRFRPSILTLLAALVVGTLLGSLIPLLAKRSGLLTWSRATATAIVVAIILELAGIFLVANNSKFVLFGFNLDPWQTLPVLLLGIANGLLGFEAAKKLKFIQDKGGSE
jgi:hypothetical protein